MLKFNIKSCGLGTSLVDGWRKTISLKKRKQTRKLLQGMNRWQRDQALSCQLWPLLCGEERIKDKITAEEKSLSFYNRKRKRRQTRM